MCILQWQPFVYYDSEGSSPPQSSLTWHTTSSFQCSFYHDILQVPFTTTYYKFLSPWHTTSSFHHDILQVPFTMTYKFLLPWHTTSSFYHDILQVPFTMTYYKFFLMFLFTMPYYKSLLMFLLITMTYYKFLLMWHIPEPYSMLHLYIDKENPWQGIKVTCDTYISGRVWSCNLLYWKL